MTTNIQIAKRALSQAGKPYVLGAEANPKDPNPRAFDCSELVEWTCRGLGVAMVDGAQNQRDFCRKRSTLVSVDRGIGTLGALLFRIKTTGTDHVAISLGNGSTIEAKGRKWGVLVASAQGRGWTHAAMIPGVQYVAPKPAPAAPPVLKLGDRGPAVTTLQRRLRAISGQPPMTGVYDPPTYLAVTLLQRFAHLPETGQADAKTLATVAYFANLKGSK